MVYDLLPYKIHVMYTYICVARFRTDMFKLSIIYKL